MYEGGSVIPPIPGSPLSAPRMETRTPAPDDYESFVRRSVSGRSFERVKQMCLDRVEDPILRERKQELLDEFDVDQFFDDISPDVWESVETFNFFRGHVFEYLVNKEMNDNDENSVLGMFIAECLRHPDMLGIPRGSLRNPDHVGVVVDVERRVAYIKGMYEVKLGKLDDRARNQLDYFYGNLDMITTHLNVRLEEFRKKYHLENIIPEGGVELLPETEINKFIVSPQPTSAQKQEEFDRKQQELWSRGWGLRASLFTSFDIDRLTVSLMNQYRANPKMMKYRDELMELAENQPRHFVPAHQRRE